MIGETGNFQLIINRFFFLVFGSSDESGAEDSDEDIITDYLSPTFDDNGNVSAAIVDRENLTANGNAAAAASIQIKMAMPAGNVGGSVAPLGDALATETANEVAVAAGSAGPPSATIPSISITQHSPAASKAFYILGNFVFVLLVPQHTAKPDTTQRQSIHLMFINVNDVAPEMDGKTKTTKNRKNQPTNVWP